MGTGRKLRCSLTWLLVIVVVGAWGVGIARWPFDYDEIYHAHTTWLIWKGQVPYHDFFVSHPPFAWYLFAPLWSLFPEVPESLTLFRLCAALGVIAWLIVMAENFRLEREFVSRSQMGIALVLVISAPSILNFALEFRPDAWCYALLFAAILVFRREWPRAMFPRFALFAFLSSIAVLSAPKCIMLMGFFTLFVLGAGADKASMFRACLALAMGMGAALLTCWLFMRWGEMDPALAYTFGIRYQAAFRMNPGFRFGLVESLLAHAWLLGFAGAGLAAWGVVLKRHGLRPNAFELAILAFLLFHPFLFEWPYKQYYAPWFLTVAGFIPYLFALFPSGKTKMRLAMLGASLAALGLSVYSLTLFARQNGSAAMLAYYHTLLEWSDRESKVVAWPPFHPLLRRDTFYGWSRTVDPSGYSTERVVQEIGAPEYARNFEEQEYWRQLEDDPPTLILAFVPGATSYEPIQAAVLGQFLRKHRSDYVLIEQHLLCPVWVRKSPASNP